MGISPAKIEKVKPFDNVSKKEQLKRRKSAYKKWMFAKTTKKAPFNMKVIAKDLGMSVEQLMHYKEKDKWGERLEKDIKNNTIKKEIDSVVETVNEQTRNEDIDMMQDILDKADLLDRHKLFIMYYLQSFNIKQSAIKCGYSESSAFMRGQFVLSKPEVKEVIDQLKRLVFKGIHIGAHDILNQYIQIAFSDITDFVEVKDNIVKVKDTDKIDGKMVTEIKQGRDGVTIKLADKMKAMEKLEKLFSIIPDKRLELEEKKFDLTEKLANKADADGDNKITIINDIR